MFKTVMWRFVLMVTLLCWGSDGVSCRDENGADVPWYILYKAPKKGNLTGLEYVYINSAGPKSMEPSMPNYKSINDSNGVLANTLEPLFTPILSMPPTFGFISYSDQTPEHKKQASSTRGHSKGVLMMDSGGPGVWLMHSTPKFPSKNDKDKFWPESGIINAQTFICVTFPYSEFSKIGLHLKEIRAFTFDKNNIDNFPQEVQDALKRTKITHRIPPQNNFRTLTSTDPKIKFYSIAKQLWNKTKGAMSDPEDGDLYLTIAENLQTKLWVQTWGGQVCRDDSYCDGKHHVLNVESVDTDLGEWKAGSDHSKWCVAEDPKKPWTCIADVNRSRTQYERPGGVLCFENDKIQQWFLEISKEKEDCPLAGRKRRRQSNSKK